MITKVIIFQKKVITSAGNMNIGTKIKMLREAKMLTQRDLSIELDISQAALCKIESGTVAKIDIALIQKLCEIFGVNFQYFSDDPVKQTNKNNHNSAISIFGNPTVHNNIPESFVETLMSNQQQISALLETQNKLIEKLLKE